MTIARWRFILVLGVALAACLAVFEAVAPRVDILDGNVEPVGPWFAIPGKAAATYRVDSVAPGGNLASAHVEPRDFLTPEDSFASRWLWRPGDAVPYTLVSKDGTRNVDIVASGKPMPPTAAGTVVRIGRLLLQLTMLALALLIAWQLPDATWTRWLCAYLACFGFAPWQVDPTEYFGWFRLVAVVFENGIIQAGICAAMMFGATILGPPASGVRLWMMRLTPIALFILEIGALGLIFDLRPVYATLPFRFAQLACVISIVVSLASAAGESTGQTRARLRYLAWTFGLGFSGFFASVAVLWYLGNGWGMNYQIWSLPRLTLIVIPLGFGYGLLSHKVVSTSYIASRTLVYGALTSSLVPLFTVAEWTANQLFSGGQGKNALFVGITVIITASFKTVRTKVNAFFDNWLFKKQHADEKALAKFAKEVPFIHDAPTLADRCMKALDEHVGSKNTALYIHAEKETEVDKNASVDYLRVAAAGDPAPERIDELDPIVVALKAEGDVVDYDALGHGGHAFPMISRGHLTGFFIFGPMRDGEILTPDETKRLVDLTKAVAMSLEAIRVTDLETRLSSVQAGRAELQRLLTDLLKPGSDSAQSQQPTQERSA